MRNTLILCNGLPPSPALLEQNMEWADYMIAADGGGNIARSHQITPDVVVGDMDSYLKKKGDDHTMIPVTNQETNDLEKALDIAEEKKAENVVILGATGKRLDHTLKNLSVMKKYDPLFNKLIIRDDFGDVFLLPPFFSRELAVNKVVSLCPLSGKVSGITTSGLKYPLDNETLENGVREGTSNRVVSNPVTIRHEEGDLILFIAR